MRQTVVRAGGFEWVDVVAPTPAELEELARDFHLHEMSVAQCLDPDHLPKVERIGEAAFIVLRAFDEFAPADGDTVQELTRKVAIFTGPRWLVTIHRKDHAWLTDVKLRWLRPDMVETTPREDLGDDIAQELMRGAIESYARPLDKLLQLVDQAEDALFSPQSAALAFQDCYFLRRKMVVFKHMLKLSLDAVTWLKATSHVENPYARDIVETGQRLLFNATEAVDSVNSVLNLHISLTAQRTNEASHRSNETMRVLTITSICFLPLNFLAGLYGMNFATLPGAAHEYGFWVMCALMAASVVVVLGWFHLKGWLRRDRSP